MTFVVLDQRSEKMYQNRLLIPGAIIRHFGLEQSMILTFKIRLCIYKVFYHLHLRFSAIKIQNEITVFLIVLQNATPSCSLRLDPEFLAGGSLKQKFVQLCTMAYFITRVKNAPIFSAIPIIYTFISEQRADDRAHFLILKVWFILNPKVFLTLMLLYLCFKKKLGISIVKIAILR